MPSRSRIWTALAAIATVGWCNAGSAQQRTTSVPLTEFLNPISASEGARILAQRDWASTNCPKHLVANMWLSPLGWAYVQALKRLDEAGFDKSLSHNSTDLLAAIKDWQTEVIKEVASKKTYDFCQEIWTTFLVVEDNASKAYWAAGWQPR